MKECSYVIDLSGKHDSKINAFLNIGTNLVNRRTIQNTGLSLNFGECDGFRVIVTIRIVLYAVRLYISMVRSI